MISIQVKFFFPSAFAFAFAIVMLHSHCICLPKPDPAQCFPVTFPTDSLVNKGQNEIIQNYRSLYDPEPSLQIKIAFDHFTFAFTQTN